jgi:hypothetical protein
MVRQRRRPVTVGPARTNAHHWSVAVVSNNSALAVRDRNHIELRQVLGVELQPDGTSGMPLRPYWEIPRVLAR